MMIKINRGLATIADGVDFDTIAREWRCKWSPDNDKKALVDAQKALMVWLLERSAGGSGARA